MNILIAFSIELDVRFNILFVFFIGLDVKFSYNLCLNIWFSFTISTSLGLTSSLSLQFSELNKLILKLVPILKLGDDISILLL